MIISCIIGRNNNYTNIQVFLHNGYVEVVKEGSAIKFALGTKNKPEIIFCSLSRNIYVSYTTLFCKASFKFPGQFKILAWATLLTESFSQKTVVFFLLFWIISLEITFCKPSISVFFFVSSANLMAYPVIIIRSRMCFLSL